MRTMALINFSPIGHPWGYRNHPHQTLRSSSQFLKIIFLQSFYQTPSVQTIFTLVNRFSFQMIVLSSYVLSIAMHLSRTHPCHLIFHSLH
jgi:hypothetical protein